jgi:hypothetical protein
MRFFIQPGTYRIAWEYQRQRDSYFKDFKTAEELDAQLDSDTKKGYRILNVTYIANPDAIRR